MNMPWDAFELEGWSIVGMNHYYVNEMRCLFVAMAKNDRCIKAEGPNEEVVFMQLRAKAESIDGRNSAPILHFRYIAQELTRCGLPPFSDHSQHAWTSNRNAVTCTACKRIS